MTHQHQQDRGHMKHQQTPTIYGHLANINTNRNGKHEKSTPTGNATNYKMNTSRTWNIYKTAQTGQGIHEQSTPTIQVTYVTFAPGERNHKRGKCKKAGSTLRSSRAVPHPSTTRALRRLTSEVGRDPVHSTRYGRQRWHLQANC